MTHDLFLHPEPGAPPRTFDEVQALLRDAQTLSPYVNEEASTPEQLVLTDRDTGAWAVLTPGGPWIDEAHEVDPRVLHLQIPYARPRFFAIEGALFAMALVQELGGSLADPSDPKDPAARPRREEEIVASWDLQNRAILAAAAEAAAEAATAGEPPPANPPRPVDGALLDAIFSHNLHRRELLERADGAVEIPRLVLASLPLRIEPAIVCGYDAGEAIWLPDQVSHVVLRLQRKGWFGNKEEARLVDADALRQLLAPSERGDEAPKGMRAFHPSQAATDPSWRQLDGSDARGLAVLDWNSLIDG